MIPIRIHFRKPSRLRTNRLYSSFIVSLRMLSLEVLATFMGVLAGPEDPSQEYLGFLFFSEITHQWGVPEFHHNISHSEENPLPSSHHCNVPEPP